MEPLLLGSCHSEYYLGVVIYSESTFTSRCIRLSYYLVIISTTVRKSKIFFVCLLTRPFCFRCFAKHLFVSTRNCLLSSPPQNIPPFKRLVFYLPPTFHSSVWFLLLFIDYSYLFHVILLI
uniref:Uncharacterized protein n=1 Tax=Opuntia streptacantha TaxID=393608 RepID=A0A7C9EGX7_OPUST